MEGSIGIIFAACAILLTLAFLGGIIALVRTLMQVSETVRRLDAILSRAEPAIAEIELATREWREIGQRVSHTAESAENLARSVEGMGTKAANAGKVVLTGIGGPIGRTLAMMNAFRIGADVFFRLAGKNQKDSSRKDGGRTKQIESGPEQTDSEQIDSSKEVGSEQ
jgi:hypothetical protein